MSPRPGAPARVDAPRVARGIIARPRLAAALDTDTPLTVLRGASGLGKTVAVVEWSREAAETVVWVTVEGSSSVALARAVLRALDGRDAHSDAPTVGERPWAVVASRLDEASLPLVLVVDDAAALERESVFDLCRTVSRAPGVRLIATVNRRSAFDHAALDLVVDRTLIGPDDLAFDADEIARALDVDETIAADILASTGGFPALIHAASLLPPPRDPGALTDAASITVEEYLRTRLDRSGVDQRRLRALTRLSVADVVTLSSARGLTGEADVEGILDEAEAFGFGRWSDDRLFVFAPVARTLLRRELQRSRASEIPHLVAAAVHAALDRRAPFEALRLAVEHDDLTLASHAIMSGWSRLLDDHGPESVRLLRHLPVSRLKDQPLIAMLLAICYLASKLRRLRGLQLLRVAIAAANSRRSDLPPTERVFIWAAESAALRLIGLSDRAAQVATRALGLFRETSESIWEPYAAEMPLLCTHLGISLYYGGREEQAIECFEYAASLAASHDLTKAFHSLSLLSGIHALNGDMPESLHYVELVRQGPWDQEMLDGYRGTFYRVAEAMLAVEAGDARAAREHVQAFGPHRSTSEHWPAMAVTEAWVALHEGRAAAGLEQLESLRRLRGREADAASARDTLSRSRALLHLAVGDVAAAREVLRHDAKGDRFGAILERARLALVEGRAAEATRLLEQTRRSPENARQRAEAVAVRSAALRRTAGPAAATRTAETLGVQLDDRDLTTPAALLPVEDAQFLRAALAELSARLPLGDAVLPGAADRPRLSSREQVVLRALTSGASLASIATDLTVSQNTVKTQLRSLYRKLGARNRSEAVEKAAEFDLLRSD